MLLKPGTRLGPYEILSAIGAGGMGEVYKARDTRLDRIVALKTLRAHLADLPELKERFEREAHTVASLQHAHICVLFDIRKDDGADYLVLEYLEGETLAARLEKGPLPLDQALQYAIEIADALDKAHRKGITHRDLKPGNIMLIKSASGYSTKLLDFGLAKLKQAAAPANDTLLDSQATTPPPVQGKRMAQTVYGAILGTPQYMSPEQAEGKTDAIDARTDIFSFGALLYEMVTGRRAFQGNTQASVIAKILETDPPPMSSLQPVTPQALDRVVRKCLAKDPDRRWQSASDLYDNLQWIKESSAQPASGTSAQPGTPVAAVATTGIKLRRMLPWTMAAVFAIAAAIAAWLLKPPTHQAVTRFALNLPPGQHLAALDQPAIAISPDGKNIVYVAVQSSPSSGGSGSQAGTRKLYLRLLDSLESKPIAGTEGASDPFFSPDGEWIGFFAGENLKKVSVNGGAAVTLAIATSPGGASWSSQGILALQPLRNAGGGGLQQISQEGGALQPLTRLGKGEAFQRWPEFLPGGKAMLFAGSSTSASWNTAQIAVERVGTGAGAPSPLGERKNLVQGASQPRYASTGHLLYAQGGTLMATPFDARRLALAGAAIPAIENVMQSTVSGTAQYSVSSTGTLVYLAGGVSDSQSRMIWVSRNGEEQILPAVPHTYQFPRVSLDGRRVAVTIIEQDTQNWVYDLSRDTLTRLTFEGSENTTPVWSPDGKRIAFRSNRTGLARNLFWQASDGSGGAEMLTTNDTIQSPSSLSTDGQLLAFIETNPQTGRDIWVLNLKDRKAQPFLKTPYEETAPKFSPDGKWLAYSSDESGRREIYVQPFPGPGGKWQISTDGGQEPVWNPKGGELFYRSGSKIMAVDVDTRFGFSAGKPHTLFDGPYLPTTASFPFYDVSPDGQRFLMLKPVESQASAPTQINVVLNWFEELKKKVPVK